MAGIARETSSIENDNIDLLKQKYEEVKLEIQKHV